MDDPLTEFRITVGAYKKMGKLIARGGVQTAFVMEGFVLLPFAFFPGADFDGLQRLLP